ncbi:MAG: DMT family transporter [Hyphomicrobiales bacterium]
MNQSISALTRFRAVKSAFYMVLAGILFAALNVLTQWLGMVLHVSSPVIAFWQYGFALIFSTPLAFRIGLGMMKTKYPFRHALRVVLAALGVQAWVLSLTVVPIGQAIALVMTSPFFIIIGARLVLRESVGVGRWLATLAGFLGAMIILEPWSDDFSPYALLPVLAALLWGGFSLLTKNLTALEPSETVTLWLLVLLTPINGALAVASDFAAPNVSQALLLLAAGVLTFFGQHLLTLAYSAADAAYVQPFDDLKLPLNVVAGWIVFGHAPSGPLGLGALLILTASLTLMFTEMRNEREKTGFD